MTHEDAVIKHHGILGQKWGVRRYQNYDGTRIKSGHMEKSREKYGFKETKYLTDDELRARTNRLNLENNYKSALDRNNDSYNDAVKWAEKTSSQVITSIVTATAIAVGTHYVGKVINSATGTDIIKRK